MSFLTYLRKHIRITRLDRYILKQYLLTIFFAIFIFVVIAIPIDYSERVNNFVENKELTAKKIILEYFLPFIPSMMALLSNIIVFISVIFFTSRMAGRSEFIAIFSAGISLKRVLKIYFIGSAMIAGVLWWASDTALPKINSIKADFTLKYIDHASESFTQYHYYAIIDSQTLLGITQYNAGTKIGTGVVLETFKNNKITRIIRAEKIIWSETEKRWILSDITDRSIKKKSENIRTYREKKLDIFISPDDFQEDQYLKERLNNKQLKNKILLETIKGSEQVTFFKLELYQRNARPVSIIILSLIGGILASRKIRGGSGLHIAIGILIAASYVIMERFSSVLSTNAGFPALLATWTPNILYGLIALFLYKKTPK